MSLKTVKPRPNFYTIIHKALRYKLYQFAMSLGTSSFSLKEIKQLKRGFDEILADLQHHASVEDRYLHPFMNKYVKDDIELLEEDHMAQEQELLSLNQAFGTLYGEKKQSNRESLGQIFYLNFNSFVARFIMHLHFEEFIVMPKLWGFCRDEELLIPHRQISKAIPASKMYYYRDLFLPAINRKEKELLGM